MKTLLILRHGKSSWKYDDLADHDRPLKKRGKDDAEKMGKLIEKNDLVPELIISSSATRARKTAKLVAYACGYGAEIVKDHNLYMAAPVDIIRSLQKVGDGYQRVMIIGHNPGLEELLANLTEHYHALPTCALARIDLLIDSWLNLGFASEGNLVNLWIPRQFRRI